MSDPTPEKKANRIPRGALVVVGVGLFATLCVLALDWFGGGSSAELEWTTTQAVKTPPAEKVGRGSEFAMDRTTISAIGQNGGDESLFRISGQLRVDTNGKKIPIQARCDIEVLDDDSSIARTPGGRAAWPRPTNELNLQKQDVPEDSVVKFNAVGNDILGLPIRDAINRYTNSEEDMTANWEPFHERIQNWVWDLPNGSGPSAALLGYVVIFKTAVKPEASIKCGASAQGDVVVQKAEAVQDEWPLPDPEIDSESEANAPDVE